MNNAEEFTLSELSLGLPHVKEVLLIRFYNWEFSEMCPRQDVSQNFCLKCVRVCGNCI